MSAEIDDLRLLQALCQTTDFALLRRACEAFQAHRWTNREYEAVFEACAALAQFGAPIGRSALAIQVTRAGFPEVDLEALFAPLPSADSELQRFLGTSGGPGR